MKDPLGLAGRSVYLPDISPEELERHMAEDTRRAILDEEMEQARITRLLRYQFALDGPRPVPPFQGTVPFESCFGA